MAEQSMVADLLPIIQGRLAAIHGDALPHVFRDAAPNTPEPGQPLPYAVIADDALPRQIVSFGDGATMGRRKFCAVRLWQSLDAEDVTLIENVLRDIDGLQLTSPRRRATVQFVTRTIEPLDEPDVCQHTIQVVTLERAHPVTLP